jgi:lipopolysaccharide export system protein LptC
MNDRPGLWFPLVLLAALAGLTTWLDFEVRSAMTEAALRDRHTPDIILHNFITQQIGRGGAVETTVQARAMRRFMDDGSSEFDLPKFEYRNAKGMVVNIRADHGHASGDQQTLEFDGQVTLHQTAKGKAQVLLETTYLKVLPQQNVASTDRPFRLSDAGTLVTGVGLDSDFSDQTLRIRSKVKVTFRPSHQHAAQTPVPAPRRTDRRVDRGWPSQPVGSSRARGPEQTGRDRG